MEAKEDLRLELCVQANRNPNRDFNGLGLVHHQPFVLEKRTNRKHFFHLRQLQK